MGCGSGNENGGDKSEEAGPRIDQNAVAHPKYPDVYVGLRNQTGGGGGTIWEEQDDGYFFGSRGLSGQGVTFSQIYDGTTNAGDKYIFDLSYGDTKETKELVYEGKETELPVVDDVKIILKPDSKPDS